MYLHDAPSLSLSLNCRTIDRSILFVSLSVDAWPDEDRALCVAAFQDGDPFDEECRAAHMSAATQIGLRTAHARSLGFLASEDPDRLRLSLEARVDRDSIRAFVEHLRQSCRDTSVASTLHKLRLFLGLIRSERDWSWLKIIARRIDAQVTPRRDPSQGVTSAVLFALGFQLMADAENFAYVTGCITKEDALTYRDGLIIALLAAVPLRRRTLAALTINRHLLKIGDHWLLDIPEADTKTRRPLEFPVPHALSGCIDLYLAEFRDAITGANDHHGLWPSARGIPMGGGAIYDAVCRRTAKALGFPVNLHRFRSAAGTLWSVSDPVNVRAVKDLLGHASFATTDKHYITAQSRLAGRALAKALRPPATK
jgi:integrase/recombinase XerD